MNSKAALVFNWMLTFIVIAILTFALVKFSSKYSKFSILGKKQFDLFATYQKGESTLFYLDQSSKYSSEQAAYELANNGGISKMQSAMGCGQYYGSSLWYNLENSASGNSIKECFNAEQLSQSLIYYFNMTLSKFIDKYPSKIGLDYDYRLNENMEMIGKSKRRLDFEIKKQ